MEKLSKRSLERLAGVHPDLVRVVERAAQITETDFTVTEGLRSRERQEEMLRKGASKLKFGKHQRQADGYGHAVDLVPLVSGKPCWDWGKPYDDVSAAMKQAAAELGVKIQWGGDWKTFKDGPHYELTEAK